MGLEIHKLVRQPGVQPTSSFAPSTICFRGSEKLFSKHKAGLVLAAVALSFAVVRLPAQQPYGYAGGYGSQYAAPAPQYNYYAQPQYQQYAQPQYPQPQYQQAQPQYSQPQYAQPQYVQPAYPQQPDNAQPYPAPQQSYADQGQGYTDLPDLADAQSAPAQQPLNAGDLEQLVAPIALYPDNLLAQILAASTYPAQVAAADQWVSGMKTQGYGSPDQIAAGAQAQNGWDPSVKALTAFPQVLDTLSQNLEWTTALGNAYYNQPQDVMQTVQVLRQRAEQAGNLQNTPQEDVSQDQGYIDVAPANPEVVYVPAYNPWAVYGQPVAPYPGFSLLGGLGSFFGASPIQFGLGIAMAAFEHTPFGWAGWGLSWRSHSIEFNHSAYSTRSNTVADWGFPHGGQRVFGGRGLPGNGYRTPQPMNRSGNGYQNSYRSSYEAGRGGSYGRPGYGYSEAGRNEGYARGSGYTHPEAPGQFAYNRMPQQFARPQPYAGRPENYAARPQAYAGGTEGYAHPGYGYGETNRPAQSYANRPGMGYASPSYRQPSYSAPNFNGLGAYGGREAYGQGFARNEHSGGFHLFGGGHESRGFDGGHAPKSFGSSGHFSGGGHAPRSFGHESAPKASHSGGGHGHRR